MKKLISLLIGCSLVLSGAALAQQPVEQQSPAKGKRPPEKAGATEAKPGPNAAKPQEKPAKQPGAMKERGATPAPGAAKGRKTPASPEPATAPTRETGVSEQRAGAPTPRAKQQAEERRKGMKGPAANAKASPHATPATAGAKATPAVPAPASPAGKQVKGAGVAKKPHQVPEVSFNQSSRIQGSEQWQGPQYEVFRSYRPEWRDQGWYRSRYSRVELIGGRCDSFNSGLLCSAR